MSQTQQIEDEKILKLWRDPTFAGSYRGIKTFQLFLKTDLDIDISEKKLYNILQRDEIYLIHKRPKKNFARRFYYVTYYGEVVQLDLGVLYEYNGFKYFLICTDVFSSKVFVEPLKTKSSEETAEALKKILVEFKAPITKIESDRGKEFLGEVKKLLKQKNIVYKIKLGKNKASIVEHYIYLVKRRLFMLLRGSLNKNWIPELKRVVNDMNNTPLKRLGWLTPNSITSIKDTVLVNKAKTDHGIPILNEPSFTQQVKNQTQYEANKNIKYQVGAYCYLDFDSKIFDKSFDVAVRN